MSRFHRKTIVTLGPRMTLFNHRGHDAEKFGLICHLDSRRIIIAIFGTLIITHFYFTTYLLEFRVGYFTFFYYNILSTLAKTRYFRLTE